jgi:hypothetical protein
LLQPDNDPKYREKQSATEAAHPNGDRRSKTMIGVSDLGEVDSAGNGISERIMIGTKNSRTRQPAAMRAIP